MKVFRVVLLLLLLATALPVCAEVPSSSPAGTSLSGQVMTSDKNPMANGVVLLYNAYSGPPPNPYRYWRIPDMVFATDSAGRFSIPLDEGIYYLMVAQKKPDGDIGPPRDSEQLYFHADDKGNPKPITMAGTPVDLGKLQGAFWAPDMSERGKGITAIDGTVVDMNSNAPVADVVVLAYYTKEARRRPAFISDRTDKQGRFSLRVAEGGNYWLRVRGVIGGGAPEAGEHLNTTDEFEPLMVPIATEQRLSGVILNVKVFDGIGSTGKPKPEKKWKRVNDLKVQPGVSGKPANKK